MSQVLDWPASLNYVVTEPPLLNQMNFISVLEQPHNLLKVLGYRFSALIISKIFQMRGGGHPLAHSPALRAP